MAPANEKLDMADLRLRCASWNVHRAKGHDGKKDAARVQAAIASSLAPFEPDILALQEADEECRPHGRILDVAAISENTGLVYQHAAEAMRWGPSSDGFLGTILWMHPRFETQNQDVIDLPGHCHRGAVVVEAQDGQAELRVLSAHLSLSQPLRIIQMRIIGQYLLRRREMQTILLGDFNEWRPWGGLMFNSRIIGKRFYGPVKRTFPARYPMLPLDRILTDRKGAVEKVQAVTTQDVRRASDHLPLQGVIAVSRSE